MAIMNREAAESLLHTWFTEKIAGTVVGHDTVVYNIVQRAVFQDLVSRLSDAPVTPKEDSN